MSERGLILALQRIHDDPGFSERVAQDPENTVGLYDLDDAERDELVRAVTGGDENILRNMAERVGIDWRSEQITGVGAMDEREVAVEGAPKLGIHTGGALPGDGYEGVKPQRPAGT